MENLTSGKTIRPLQDGEQYVDLVVSYERGKNGEITERLYIVQGSHLRLISEKQDGFVKNMQTLPPTSILIKEAIEFVDDAISKR